MVQQVEVPHAAHVLTLCSMHSGTDCVEATNNLGKHTRDEPAVIDQRWQCRCRASVSTSRMIDTALWGPKISNFARSLHRCTGSRNLHLHRSADRKPIAQSQPSQKGWAAICDDRVHMHFVIPKGGMHSLRFVNRIQATISARRSYSYVALSLRIRTFLKFEFVVDHWLT
jgi:hypothetical protein